MMPGAPGALTRKDLRLKRRAVWALYKAMIYWERKDPVYFCSRGGGLVQESLNLSQGHFKIVQALIKRSWEKLSLAQNSEERVS